MDNHLSNINIKIKKGELVAIVGGFGSGKSSFVNCIIGEMNKKQNPKVSINGSIAYASQVPWIMNDTIRNNILFGNKF
jgi:ABC-type multidrug transport system fused ATPase/permease subunit